MTQIIISLALFFGTAAAVADDYGTRVDFLDFARGIQGTYKVTAVGGAAPKEEDNVAGVSVEPTEVDFSMPYCAPGTKTCDPGYLFFTPQTQAFKKELGTSHVLYTILVGNQKYEWEDNEGTIMFRNFQYRTVSGTVITLEHQLQRQ